MCARVASRATGVPCAGMRRVLALVVALAGAGISADAVWSQLVQEGPPEAELRNCRSRAEGRAPIQMVVRPNDFRIGPLVLGNVRSADGDGPSGDPEWPIGRKIPVLLPARSRVVLAIAPEARDRAELQHRNTFVQAVRFTSCFERVPAWAYHGTVGSTTFFPFGIRLRERSLCLPMELWTEGRALPVRRLVPINRRSC